MQLTAEHASNRSPSASPDQIQLDESMASHVTHADYKIIRRNGAVVAFEPAKISIAMTKAFLAVNGGQGAASARVREQVAVLTASVVNALVRRLPHGGTFHIEDIQDQVELALMRSASTTSPAPTCSTARSVPPNVRQKQRAVDASAEQPVLHVVDGDRRMPLDRDALRTLIQDSCENLGDVVSVAPSSTPRSPISTTACRSTKCASRPSWPPAR
jgi:ribonucleoside-diphosphate reductase alpha chain